MGPRTSPNKFAPWACLEYKSFGWQGRGGFGAVRIQTYEDVYHVDSKQSSVEFSPTSGQSHQQWRKFHFSINKTESTCKVIKLHIGLATFLGRHTRLGTCEKNLIKMKRIAAELEARQSKRAGRTTAALCSSASSFIQFVFMLPTLCRSLKVLIIQMRLSTEEELHTKTINFLRRGLPSTVRWHQCAAE